MDFIIFVGRILFVLLFLSSAVSHITSSGAMAGYAQSKGVPAAKAAVIGSGVLFGLGGLSVLFGIWADLGALLIFITLLPTAIVMHAFWKERDPATRQKRADPVPQGPLAGWGGAGAVRPVRPLR